ncbi:MAG: hypothetical protein ACR2JQ_09960 [Mycobacteriales bacterium]
MTQVTLRYFDGCPNWQLAEQRLHAAAAGRTDVTLVLQPVETQADAERLGFTGSPTILIDGIDPFAEPGATAGLSCRLYRTGSGTAGAPTQDQLQQALTRPNLAGDTAPPTRDRAHPPRYRRYAPQQVAIGRLVGLLRGADLSLAAIKSVIAELPTAPEAACARLEVLLDGMDREHHSRRLVVRHVQSILHEETDPMFAIKIREVPARRLMSIQRRQYGDLTDAFVDEAKDAFTAHLGDIEPTGPFTLIFHGPVNDQADGPIEAALGVPTEIEPTDLIGIRTEPAHTEAYTTITKREWDYPAILAAYDAVACSPQASARSRSPLSCREVYLADPASLGDDDPICDIAFPLGR